MLITQEALEQTVRRIRTQHCSVIVRELLDLFRKRQDIQACYRGQQAWETMTQDATTTEDVSEVIAILVVLLYI